MNLLHILSLLCATSVAGGAIAQMDLHFDGNIPVSRQGVDLDLAWGGGINSTQVSRIDLDMDGLKDLFFFDRTGNRVTILRNTGGTGTAGYEVTREFDHLWPFPVLHDWALLRDYNCDGKEDIFTYSSAGFSVYRNISTADGAAFEFVEYRVECEYVFTDGSSQRTNLFVSSDDLPGFVDVDSDGDLDVLTFAQLGSFVQYYKNLTLENHGTCDSLDFVLRNGCWGRFAENAATNDVTLNVPCPFQVPAPEIGGPPVESVEGDGVALAKAHSGSTVTPLDLDGDNVMDLLLGDITFPNIVALNNGGTTSDSFMSSVDDEYPVYDTSVELPIFPGAFHLDVDGDDKRDLLVSPNGRSLSQNFKSLWYYTNTGTDAAPVFELQQEDLFQSRMIDLGNGAYPIPFDHNGDGLMDLIVANDGYYNPGIDFIGKIALLENTGTLSAPAFEFVTDDYMSLSTSGIGVAMYPAFGDVDGDGDKDMYIGDQGGVIHFYRNTATGPIAQFVLDQPNITDSEGEVIDLGMNVTPQFNDMDGDGLLDLIVGEQNGNLNYLRNSGTATDAAWTLVTDSLGHVMTEGEYSQGFSVPFLFENAQGDREMLVGSDPGWLWHYTNIDGNLDGTWTLTDTSFMDIRDGYRTSLCLYDFTGDEELDLVIGNFQGGLSFWRSDVVSGIAGPARPRTEVTALPNPTDGSLELITSAPLARGSYWVFRNSIGQEVARIPATGSRTTTDLSGLAAGIYVVRAEGSATTEPIRVVVSDGPIR
ncbi:MAG: T9SS type A sorting domain-containing protein [Flavobacteriales bacterium]|nr:T9SS type A sorting domain-containing protein [Flavobacteriales bacterium]